MACSVDVRRDRDRFARVDWSVRHFERRAPRGEERRAFGGQLRATGDVVGMRVGVRRPLDAPTSPGGHLALPVGEPGRVDHQRRAVTEADDVGRVAEAFVHHALDDQRTGLCRHAVVILACRRGCVAAASAVSDAGTSVCGELSGPDPTEEHSTPEGHRVQRPGDRHPATGGVVGHLPCPSRLRWVAVIGAGPVREPPAGDVELIDGGPAPPRPSEDVELDDPLGPHLERHGLVDDRGHPRVPGREPAMSVSVRNTASGFAGTIAEALRCGHDAGRWARNTWAATS